MKSNNRNIIYLLVVFPILSLITIYNDSIDHNTTAIIIAIYMSALTIGVVISNCSREIIDTINLQTMIGNALHDNFSEEDAETINTQIKNL